jgi:hypothetical protein
MILTGRETEQLTDALLSAFPKNTDLEQFVLVELSTRLNWYVDVTAGLRQQVVDLVTWAADQRRLHELIAGAVRRRPDNPLLRAFAAEVAAKGESVAAIDDARAEPAQAFRRLPGEDGYALYCNRSAQWDLVNAPAFEAASELVFVPGGFEQGHDYFVKRIKRRVAVDPKSIVEIGLPPSYAAAAGRGELLELLAAALDLHASHDDHEKMSDDIAAALARRLAQRNIVLVHATLSLNFPAVTLPYYTEWLPDILRRTRRLGSRLMCLKCYQSVEWLALTPLARVRAALTRVFSAPDAHESAHEARARKLIADIAARQASDVLRVRALPDLEDITKQDLIDLCEKWAVSDTDDQRQLVERCGAASTSSGKLKIVDALLPSLVPREVAATLS